MAQAAYKRIAEVEAALTKLGRTPSFQDDLTVLQIRATLAVAEAIIEVGNVQGAVEDIAAAIRYSR